MTDKLGTANQPRRHGPLILPESVVFNLRAPSARSIELLEAGQPPRKMPKDAEGSYQLLSPTARVGSRYQFRINGVLVAPPGQALALLPLLLPVRVPMPMLPRAHQDGAGRSELIAAAFVV
ncbi:hypothetical protein [Bradyrhizobium japonicum]|uniref:hypothetical protein n=1 Tax=Bradyrhizobium japonicum TaxID=375 RepID=UPI00271453E9|nr:hypothetical protein [Bradyrhizobium japonicum]WLB24223.1 hypothetical protein QIH95_47495 [Bradyrhizobium japonicum]